MPTKFITPLSIDLKKKVSEEMTLSELEQLLGPNHEVYGSGVSYFLWYFDDTTCLALFYTGSQHDAEKKFFWLPCEAGKFKINMIK